MPDISVIIPMFNSELFIVSCIQSVISQTYDNFEVIVVDDGSQDNCRKLCEKICEKDKRIRLITQKHKGVSTARNIGIEKAKGRYIFFLDSDDIIHSQLIENLYMLLTKTDACIATEGYCNIKENEVLESTDWKTYDSVEIKSSYLNNCEAVDALIWGNREASLYTVGGKMIRRELLDSVRFDEELTNGEDTLFLYQLLMNGADVVILQHNWYCYRKHAQGANNTYSVTACQSRYLVEQYICACEIKNDRLSNAKHWENDLLTMMVYWYKKGLDGRSKDLVTYVKNLARIEKRKDIFSQIDSEEKKRFCSVFSFFSIYKNIYIYSIWRRIVAQIGSFWKTWSPSHPRIRRCFWIIRRKNKQ